MVPVADLGQGRYKEVSKLVTELENDSFYIAPLPAAIGRVSRFSIGIAVDESKPRMGPAPAGTLRASLRPRRGRPRLGR